MTRWRRGRKKKLWSDCPRLFSLNRLKYSMLTIILIAFFSLIGLLILHELSHFFVAKKCGVVVEEFGVGYPPKICGKEIKGTLYSLNLLPFGAFVKIPPESLNSKPIWQRFLIISAGIISFWIFCFAILSIVFMMGALVQIDDEDVGFENPQIQIVAVAPNSPAEQAGMEVGDIIRAAIDGSTGEFAKVSEVQQLIEQSKGSEIQLLIERGADYLVIIAEPRVSPPEGEGSLGVALARVAIKKYSLRQALSRALGQTFQLTIAIIVGLGQAIYNLFVGKPTGVEMVGPIGIMNIFVQTGGLGASYFLQTMAIISLNLAIFNALPLPVSDGGKILLLVLEKIRKKPLNEATEEKIYKVFFVLLLVLMVWVTVKDIVKLF